MNHHNRTDISNGDQFKDDMSMMQQELKDLQQELLETSKGTLALYNEIDAVNRQLEAKQAELEEKNRELAQTLKELKESETERLKAVRSAAIGSVVVTYNHEINNPLAIIFGSIDILMLEKDKLPKNVIRYIEMIGRASSRIGEVIHKIKEYEKLLPKDYLNWELLDLHLSKDENGEQDKEQLLGKKPEGDT